MDEPVSQDGDLQENSEFKAENERAQNLDRKGCLIFLGGIGFIICFYFIVDLIQPKQETMRIQQIKVTKKPMEKKINKKDFFIGRKIANLHYKNGKAWFKASYENKYNTCADLLLKRKKQTTPETIKNLLSKIDSFYENTSFLELRISEIIQPMLEKKNK